MLVSRFSAQAEKDLEENKIKLEQERLHFARLGSGRALYRDEDFTTEHVAVER